MFVGFGSLPGTRSVFEQECILYAKGWSRQGLYFASLLFSTSAENSIRNFFGFEQKYFDIMIRNTP